MATLALALLIAPRPTGSQAGASCGLLNPCKGTHIHCQNKECACDPGYEGDECSNRVSCGPAPSPPHSTGCSGEKHYLDSCTASCTYGYTGGPTTHATFTCGADKRYSGSLTCTPVSCPTPTTPEHATASVDCDSMHYGQKKCTMTCEDCYSDGNHDHPKTPISEDIACQPDGKLNVSGAGLNLQCKPVSCGPVPPRPNHTHTDTSRWSGNKFCADPPLTAKCLAGWTGGKKKQQDYRCTKSRKYTGSLSCERVLCDEPVVRGANGAKNADTSRCIGKYFQDTCTVNCTPGYTAATPSQYSDGRPMHYTCIADGSLIGNAAPAKGIWSPDPGLQCEGTN